MPHPPTFGGKIITICLVDTDDEWCSGDDINAVFFQLVNLLRIVGEQVDLLDTQCLEHVRSDCIISAVTR